MATITSHAHSDDINVYLVGNNPTDLSSLNDKLKSIKGRTFSAEIGFDLSKVYTRIMNYKPVCILIDDNLGKHRLRKLVRRLTMGKKTKDIPIAILKNSNSGESVEHAQDFILKESVTSDILRNSILNSMRLKGMQDYLKKTYKTGKSQFLDFLSK